jgi:DnaJ-class molecular chaperone
MGCDSCKSNEKLDKLFSFLGIYICCKCKGRGRIEENTYTCSCCRAETITCPECKGEEFIVEEHSILKSLVERDQDDDQDDTGLCD